MSTKYLHYYRLLRAETYAVVTSIFYSEECVHRDFTRFLRADQRKRVALRRCLRVQSAYGCWVNRSEEGENA